ncbi:tail fiber domain-containing protein [Sphingobium sp. CFD-1]|uniref:tail fiber domain-containing protein n=1 Tax=Sphingobium sp. CFD-1 TaxID=2878545 RepID=UPI00214BD5CD|nr:tail fiber domain-containing protein [Sphingobium sp. CFD-1]
MAITDWEMADLVREVCYDVGTGPLTLGGAMMGYRAFADAVGTGARFPYVIVGVTDASQWEAGSGMLDGEGRLARTVGASSAGGAAVDFAAGEKRVALALHAAWARAVEAHDHAPPDLSGIEAALAGKQAASGVLDALAGVEGGADRLLCFTGMESAEAISCTPFARSLLDDADAAAARVTLGVQDAGGDMLPDEDDAQALGSPSRRWSALHAVSIVSDDAQIGGGRISGIDDLAIADGGTGASTAAQARANLELGSMATQNAGAVAITGGSAVFDSFGVVTTGDPYINRFAGTSAASAAIAGRRARGTVSTPAPVQTSDILGGMYMAGYQAVSNGWTANVAAVYAYATEDYSSSGYGADIAIATTAIGSTTRAVRVRISSAAMTPGGDNNFALGAATSRWSVVYAGTGTINTSDAREKRDVDDIPEALLDAWGDVTWRRFRFVDAVALKGGDARWHVGLIAQQVRDAIDARMGAGEAVRLGLVCLDSWEAETEERDEEGQIVRPGRDAGDRWGLRYEECLALEAAWQRRRIAGIEAALAQLSGGPGDGG